MSETTRVLCQMIEARPFLTLTDRELELVALALAAEVARHNPVGNSIAQEYLALGEKAWREAGARRQPPNVRPEQRPWWPTAKGVAAAKEGRES